jgi:hypothetical protein
MCSRPYRPIGLPIYVARVPAAPFTHRYPLDFALITALPGARASYPSYVAVYPRDARSRRVLCCGRMSLFTARCRFTTYEIILFSKKKTPACVGGNHPGRPGNIRLNVCPNHYHD